MFFVEEPLVKIDDELFVLTGVFDGEFEKKLLELGVFHDGVLIFIDALDEFEEDCFFIDCLIIDFYGFSPDESYT